ncbi:hypothetical protein EVAR_70367_1 [Eumeta japonica]|uniref:Uncharacterized protein n=1 Tax=Eumeta variegata TaxID=151549 RepID=A0A4C1TF72_EUMVA|nr:hypothetical protein EVAR_70367_1 [Eumeta japonica]
MEPDRSEIGDTRRVRARRRAPSLSHARRKKTRSNFPRLKVKIRSICMRGAPGPPRAPPVAHPLALAPHY